MYDVKKDMGVLIAEYCMSFGLSPASNIAQRLAILITDIVKKNFDAEEKERMLTETDPELLAWWAEREQLSSVTGNVEARAYTLEMYTDDPLGAVAGEDRAARFLVCWSRVTTRMRLLMATAVKRQFGASVKWNGARYYNAGIILIQKDKRMKAMKDLLDLVHWRLCCADLRSLNGLLEFFMVVVRFKRNKMAGMYEPWKAGGEAEDGGDDDAIANVMPTCISVICRHHCANIDLRL